MTATIVAPEVPTATLSATAAPEHTATREPMPIAFRRLLANTLVTSFTSSFLWFALTFWVFLETRSVLATGFVAGAFSLSSAALGPLFGTFVDRHRKHTAMMLATALAVVGFGVATAVYAFVDSDARLQLAGPWFWLLIGATLVGAVAAQMRGIALSTCVTLLVPESQRDRANGMVGAVNGVSFAVTSVASGLVVGQLGMGWAYGGSLVLIAGGLLHLRTIRIHERQPDRTAADAAHGVIDVRGAVDAIRAVPGLKLLIALATFNNLLGGVLMALMDAYGLSLVSVETWGVLWGFIMLAFIAGGLVVAKRGLGSNPLRMLLLGNITVWAVCSTFALRSSIVLLTVGMVVWLALIPVIEAAEHTVLQRSIPFEQQGRVLGFAQMVENAAAPITAFLMAPLAQSVFMPLMTDGRGADWIGGWFGTGPERGLALMFTLVGVIGVAGTSVARRSRAYARLQSA
jgi:DHA3 family multidrug efflux protein-like MFS transporter